MTPSGRASGSAPTPPAPSTEGEHRARPDHRHAAGPRPRRPGRAAAHRRTDRVLDIRDAALTAANASPADDLAAGLTDGTLTPDTVGDRLLAAAVAATAQEKAHTLLRDLQVPLVPRFAQAVRADADRLLADLRKVFTPAAKTMQKAGALFPVGATGEQVLTAGANAATAWRGLEQARRTLDTVHGVRVTLARDYGIGQVQPEVLMYVRDLSSEHDVARATEAWDRHDVGTGIGGRWHALTAAGFALSLATQAQIIATRVAIDRSAQAEQNRQRVA